MRQPHLGRRAAHLTHRLVVHGAQQRRDELHDLVRPATEDDRRLIAEAVLRCAQRARRVRPGEVVGGAPDHDVAAGFDHDDARHPPVAADLDHVGAR